MRLESAAFLALCIFATDSLFGTDRIVGGGGNYTTIQAAVNAANSGDVVKIKSGSYSESLTVNKANITLEAYDQANPPTLDGGRVLSGLIWTSEGNYVYSASYRLNSDLNPANDIYGFCPPSYLKQDIRIEGRFRYDQTNGKLYVRTPGLDSPNWHTYNIPEIF
ncbi:MAG: hypothetical protein WC071_05940 [Victivallaceae bacterium]